MERASARHACTATIVATFVLSSSLAGAGDHMTAAEVRAAVAARGAGKPLTLAGRDMSGEDLSNLDLTGADLRQANLAGANLYGVKLVDADLSDADLRQANLVFTWIIRANFTRARLRGATLKTIVTSTTMDNKAAEAATFVGADLSQSTITVHFSFDDMRGADFTGATMTADMRNQSMGLIRTEFDNARLDGAIFDRAGLGHVTFRYAKLDGTRFVGADADAADFSGAQLDGADFTGASLTATIFDGASVANAKGLPAASR